MEFKFRWSPYLIYTITSKELRDWYVYNGFSAFREGKMWKPVSEKLVPGLVKVSFTEA